MIVHLIKKKTIEGGFNNSPLNLNSYLRTANEWNEDHIQQRAEQLATIASIIWHYPIVSEEKLKSYAEAEKREANEYTLSQYDHLSGEMLKVFEELRKRILKLDESVKEEYKKTVHSLQNLNEFR